MNRVGVLRCLFAGVMFGAAAPATALLAAVFFREHLGSRVLASVMLITFASALLIWQSGAAIEVGALFVIAACVCWGLDNCITARIEHLAPELVAELMHDHEHTHGFTRRHTRPHVPDLHHRHAH